MMVFQDAPCERGSFISWAMAVLFIGGLFAAPPVRAGVPVGACCVSGTCQDNGGIGIDLDTCTNTPGGIFQGDGSTCATTVCASVPAASEWGLAVMVLLSLTCGTVIFRRRTAVRHHAAVGMTLLITAVVASTASAQQLVPTTRESSIAARRDKASPRRVIAQPKRRFSARVTRLDTEEGSIQSITMMTKPRVLRINGKPVADAAFEGESTSVAEPGGQPANASLVGNDFYACNGPVTAEVVATELTYGTNGPDVPLKLEYQLGQTPAVELFAGQDLQGMETPPAGTDTFTVLSGGVPLAFAGRAAYPDFSSPTPFFSRDVASSDANNALILLAGDELAPLLAAKSVNGPFGNQLSIATALQDKGFLTAGVVTGLNANEVLILFELGTTNQTSTAFDFQDLIVKVTFPCPVLGDVVVADRIGYQAALTDGTLGLVHWTDPPLASPGNDWRMAGTVFTPPVSGTLSTFSLVMYGVTNINSGQSFVNGIDWDAADYEIHIWDCVQDTGSCSDVFFTTPTGGTAIILAAPSNANFLDVLSWIDDDGAGPHPLLSKHRFDFDLSSLGYHFQVGHEYVIGITVLRNASTPPEQVFEVPDASMSLWDDPTLPGDVFASITSNPLYPVDVLGSGYKWFGSAVTVIPDAPLSP